MNFTKIASTLYALVTDRGNNGALGLVLSIDSCCQCLLQCRPPRTHAPTHPPTPTTRANNEPAIQDADTDTDAWVHELV